jgi:hypothetical protein
MMTTAPLQRTLDTLAQAGAYYAISLDAPEDGAGWFCPADLTDPQSATFAWLADAVKAKQPEASRRYTGLLIYTRCVYLLAAVCLNSALMTRRVPMVDWSTLRFHWNEGGWIDAMALGTTAFYALPDDPEAAHPDAQVLGCEDVLRDTFRQRYEAAIASLIPAFKAQSGMGVAALWAVASDACAYPIITTLQKLGNPETCDAEIAALLEAYGSKLTRKSGVIWVEHLGVREPFFKRTACCLWYTIPGNEQKYCSTCPLRPLEERQALARKHMEEQLAAAVG